MSSWNGMPKCVTGCQLVKIAALLLLTTLVILLTYISTDIYTDEKEDPNYVAALNMVFEYDFLDGESLSSGYVGPEDVDEPLEFPALNLEKYTFFLETSGTGKMSLRQLLGVEAAARNLRDLRHLHVYILLNHDLKQEENFMKSHIMMSLEARYRAVRFHFLTFEKALNGTNLQDWYRKGVWRNSTHIPDHLSDGIRFLFLDMYGGLYLDFDVIFQKWVTFGNNSVFWESNYLVGTGILAFQQGHPFCKNFSQEFISSFNPYGWTSNGPDIAHRLYQRCLKSGVCDVIAFPVSYMMPLDWTNLTQYFDETKTSIVLQKVVGSPAVHYSNSITKNITVKWNSTCAFARIAQMNCPLVWAEVEKIGWI